MMTGKDFKAGFFGRGYFDKEARTKFREEWAKMTDNEKLDFMNKRVDAMSDQREHFSIEAIDVFCTEWIKKSPEEKDDFINERKRMFQERMACMNGFPSHDFGHRFSHGWFECDSQKKGEDSFREQFQ